MNVSIIGTGNVANILGRKIVGAGHKVLEVVGRDVNRTIQLAELLNSMGISNIQKTSRLVDLYIIAVSDSSIIEIAANLQVNNKLVVHTAASVSKELLKNCSCNYGVIYPVQSLRKEVIHLPVIPVLVDGSSEEVKSNLFKFSSTWADNVSFANDDERLKLHIGAVVVNNFTNHLFTYTEEYCRNERLEFNILYPLIKETIERLKDNDPSSLQTGPAVRHDLETIKKHLSILSKNPAMAKLYKFMSDDIIQYYFSNKD